MQLTFDEIRAAIILIKRAPLKGEEASIVAQTLFKLEATANEMLRKQDTISDDSGTAE